MALTAKEQVLYDWLIEAFPTTLVIKQNQDGERPKGQDYITFNLMESEGHQGYKQNKEAVDEGSGPEVKIQQATQKELLVSVTIYSENGLEMHETLQDTDKSFELRALLKKAGFSLQDYSSTTNVTKLDATKSYNQYVGTYTFLAWVYRISQYNEILKITQSGTVDGVEYTTVTEKP